MAHPRKLLRHAVVALLVAANTAAATRVKPTRVEPHKRSELPALGVYTLNDPVLEDESTETEQMHELELEVVGWVGHTDDLPADDAMDDLAEEVEAVMVAAVADPENEYLAGLFVECDLIGTTMQVVEDNGRTSPHVGIIVLTYAVKYRSPLTSTAELDDFLRAKATHKVNGITDEDDAVSDEFTVQETPP